MYRRAIKPFFDIIIAMMTFVVMLPLFLIITVILTLVLGGSPFFFQKRPGKNGKIFTIIKFRTMSNETDENDNLLPDKDRLTTFGKFIRSLSLDEIPQLLNVISGKMSIVGPRPLLPQYLPLYDEHQRRRHEVNPGITGWAQVNGRNAISWQDKFNLDVYYVDNLSFMLDLRILFRTIVKVIKSDGITDSITETTTYFQGNETK